MPKKIPILRLSYTMLNLWKSGKTEDAIRYYFKIPISDPSIAMLEGREWDQKANDYALANLALLPEFGGWKLTKPRTQEKWEATFSKHFQLVGIPDIVDLDTLYELKTGSSKNSGGYALDFQVGMYLLLAELNGIKINQAYIIHYNQHDNTHNKTLIWNTEFERKRAENFINTIGGDIYSHFQEHGLFSTTREQVIDMLIHT